MPVIVSVEGVQTLASEVQIAFYRIAQEALNNAAKHAGASSAVVALSGAPEGEGTEIVLVWAGGLLGIDGERGWT